MVFWFCIYCALAGLNGVLARQVGKRGWVLLWPLRLTRVLFEAPWAGFCGLRIRGFGRHGSGTVLRLPRRNFAFRFGHWWLIPALALAVCLGLASGLEIALDTLDAGGGLHAGLFSSVEQLARFQPLRCAGLFLTCLLLLPLSCLELPSAPLLFASGFVLSGLVEALDGFGLSWRTFSDGWFASWWYAELLEQWFAGLFLCASLACLLSALALTLVGAFSSR